MRPPFLSNTILHMRILGLLLLLAMGLAACRDKGPKTEVVYATDPNVMKVGSKDSAAVKTLVTMFMDRMKSGHPDSALMLLRTAKPGGVYRVHENIQTIPGGKLYVGIY